MGDNGQFVPGQFVPGHFVPLTINVIHLLDIIKSSNGFMKNFDKLTLSICRIIRFSGIKITSFYFHHLNLLRLTKFETIMVVINSKIEFRLVCNFELEQAIHGLYLVSYLVGIKF